MVPLFIPVHGMAFLMVPVCVLSFCSVLAIMIHDVRYARTMTVKARMRQFALREQSRRSSLSTVSGAEEHPRLSP